MGVGVLRVLQLPGLTHAGSPAGEMMAQELAYEGGPQAKLKQPV